jgi:hypothetical protein
LGEIGFAPGFDQVGAGSFQGCGAILVAVFIAIRPPLDMRHGSAPA